MQSAPENLYTARVDQLNIVLKQLLKKRYALGWTRFLVFAATILIAYKVFVAAGLAGFYVVISGLAILLFLISIDVDNTRKILNTKTLIRVNEEEQKFLHNDYEHFYEGSEFAPASHDYANDLDLFGKYSLYQWMNRCYTEQGRSKLADNLLSPLNINTIAERHEAIKEITGALEWRQQLQAYAMQTVITKKTEQKTKEWLSEQEKHFIHPVWRILIEIYSIVAIASAIAAIFEWIPLSTFTVLFLIYFFVSGYLSKSATEAYTHLTGIVKEIDTLQLAVAWIESKEFKSPLLKKLCEESRPPGKSAAAQIKSLKGILDRFDMRLNFAAFLFLNSFLLWDVRQMIALNKWRKTNRAHAEKWFSMIAEMEVLHSFSTLHFNQPAWVFPQFTEQHLTFQGICLGHPLIPAGHRIDNDFTIQGVAKIGLITGSNMAGKSTFLRSLGVNILMAQAGAPVCAKSLTLSPVRLMSSMRIADNLTENTSTFYAELKKLKTIIDAANRHEHVFILLDEILRGTNSFDRHKGSEALIAQLIREKAVAVIATHDVELAVLQEEFPNAVENYNFDVQVAGEELYFDYKLKHGVCTSMNASILMKKIGIELA
jgi:ABC-type multidrug transport system fused ATPase/permease subunit